MSPEPQAQDKGAAPDQPTRMRKHSLVIAGHRTSISLENAFWLGLREIAQERNMPVARLVAEIDASRGESNLSSAIRVFVLRAFALIASRR
jgi:predicted DNA-binding ribbon-helix-helix protein